MENPSILPGIREFDRERPQSAPEISDVYRQNIERLVLMQRNGVTHFYGGPLHLDDEKDVWLSPVEVDDGEQYPYFQLLYVNTKPEEVLSNPDRAASESMEDASRRSIQELRDNINLAKATA